MTVEVRVDGRQVFGDLRGRDSAEVLQRVIHLEAICICRRKSHGTRFIFEDGLKVQNFDYI